MSAEKTHKFWIWLVALVAVAFGLMTVKEGGLVLYGNEAAVSAAGDYVPFVLWFNFIAGFFYILAGIGLWLQKPWAVWLAVSLAAATAFVFAAFGLHVALGGAFAQRTVIAMSLRTAIWAAIAVIAWQQIRKRQLGGASP
ncbi:hypothetical protein [Marinicella gelatinilytica]|uniref:hypothetical protein n=1 Tax=Marinicella gelatinilytica TaxID=2996017 RepID=UPI002260A630|nr:hypothetical protein [Marinicella gelatinilytica]MCX7546105.1 hypothetical protein [Marinicella gelatinilytica]